MRWVSITKYQWNKVKVQIYGKSLSSIYPHGYHDGYGFLLYSYCTWLQFFEPPANLIVLRRTLSSYSLSKPEECDGGFIEVPLAVHAMLYTSKGGPRCSRYVKDFNAKFQCHVAAFTQNRLHRLPAGTTDSTRQDYRKIDSIIVKRCSQRVCYLVISTLAV